MTQPRRTVQWNVFQTGLLRSDAGSNLGIGSTGRRASLLKGYTPV